MKVKAKNMTRADAVPYLRKILKKQDGKKRRRALELAIEACQGRRSGGARLRVLAS